MVMKQYLTAFIIGVSFLTNAQFSDDFLDGDFTTTPAWSGDDANFEIDADNQLHLLAPAVTDVSYLSVPTTSVVTTWDFLVKLDFDPSSSNYARVYLMSDNADLEGSLNGYYVMLGNTSDEISLYRQDGTGTTEILDGIDETFGKSTNVARVRVTRDAGGNWELLRDTTGSYSFVSEGTVNDATHSSSTHFGVYCNYTSSRSELFYFDDLGDPYVDTAPPSYSSLSIISNTELDVSFSEPVSAATSENTANYLVDGGIGNPTTAVRDATDSSLVHLSFGTPFTNATNYNLEISNVEDNATNVMFTTDVPFFYFIEDVAVPGDVIVTEIMADPTPTVGLPEFEWFEIHNRTTDKYFDLDGWVVTDGSTFETMTTYVLQPGEYVVIVETGDGPELGISNYLEGDGIPTFTNGEDDIIIRNDLGITIDSVHYFDDWHADSEKDDGGWTLELKHLNSPCANASNWSSSIDPTGGTPGLQNSIFTDVDDIIAPEILTAEVTGTDQVLVTFNESMDTLIDPVFTFNPSFTSSSGEFTSQITYDLTVSTFSTGTVYEMTATVGKDCWGNAINSTVNIGLPDVIEAGDLIVNEILFNPQTGGDDYVEIYNNSDKILDLSEVYLANYDDEMVDNLKQVSFAQYLLYPGEYVCVTEDSTTVIDDFIIYGIGRFIQTDIPTYVNDSATVYLVLEDTSVIDYVHYDEDYHFSLISDVDGKSLERINFDGDSNDPENWHTAAETANWGTPGYENSQNFSPNVTGEASVDPAIFSPDNDGFQDVVSINLSFLTVDNVVDVEIYDNQGRLIRELEDNTFVGTEATFIWDGTNDDGEKAQIGTYVALVTGRTGEDEQFQHKLVIVVAGNL